MLAVSYAKINLFLEVIDRLESGYHQVNTVLCGIDLFDCIKFSLTKSGSPIVWSSNAKLNGQNNLMYKIADYLRTKYGLEESVEIYLEKRIPIAAGLGGGSSNAAIAILALDKLWRLDLASEEKHEIAARFGSDINFFLEGGTALGENRGERISRMDDILIDNILLVNPGIEIPASIAYGAVELPAPGEAKLYDPKRPIATMYNRLESGIRKLYPKVDRILCTLDEFGSQKSMLSGSGSTCFGIFENENDLAICQKHFHKLGFYTHKTKTLSRREYQKCFPS